MNDKHKKPQKDKYKKPQKDKKEKPDNDDVDEALDESFPASDPPSYTTPRRKGHNRN